MKVISVRQPWAWAIIHGGKDVENRNWPTPTRGRVAIHAGKQFDINVSHQDWADFSEGQYGEPWKTLANSFGERTRKAPNDVRGAIIGTVEIYDCIRDIACKSKWKAGGDDFYCWLLRNPVALREHIPMKGRLGFWDVPDELFPEGGEG